MAGTPTIFEWAGGREAFARWLDAFYDLVEGDELLAPLFGGKVTAQHPDPATPGWGEVMGGAAPYTAELGGYEHMLAKHRGLAISDDQRLRFVTLLSRAADLAGLPADPEFRAAIMGYAEWGTRLAPAHPAPPAPRPGPAWGVGRRPALSAVTTSPWTNRSSWLPRPAWCSAACWPGFRAETGRRST